MASRISVVGAGISGVALAVFARRMGYSVFVTDKAVKISDSAVTKFKESHIEWECGEHSRKCTQCDLMVVSSGVPESSQAVVMAREAGVKVIGELDFLSPHLKGKLIGITGSNGKTTTTSLTAHLLQSAGLDAVAAGNIGNPLGCVAGEEHDAIVMELSSFQLHWNTLLAPDVSVLTNLAPDHIDWHGSYENYMEDKCKVFIPKQSACYAIVHECDAPRVPTSRTVCAIGNAPIRIELGDDAVSLINGTQAKELFKRAELKLLGFHNLENAAMASAAIALAFPDINPACGLSEFKAPRHRCELVCEKHGVLYVDDSKGTNVASVITALNSVPGRKVIILGGQGKGETYEKLAEAVKKCAKAAVVLGSEADKICYALEESGYKEIHRVKDIPEAVKVSSTLASSGDTVLLSPACTSWDMYRNYKERGDHFAQCVKEIK